MWNAAVGMELIEDDRALLERWVNALKTPQSVVLRARIILLANEGWSNTAIAEDLEVSRPTVILWRKRFEEGGPFALTKISPGRGRKPQIPAAKLKAVIEATTRSHRPGRPVDSRSMAKAQGLSPATIQRIWDADGLYPHRVSTFKVSNDKHFVDKFTDVVGSISIQRTGPWFSASMRSRRSRLLIAPSRVCR